MTVHESERLPRPINRILNLAKRDAGRIEWRMAEVLNDNDADYLGGAFNHITGLLLHQQLDDFLARRPVTNYVHPDDLSTREKDILLDSLKAIDNFAKPATMSARPTDRRVPSAFTFEVLRPSARPPGPSPLGEG